MRVDPSEITKPTVPSALQNSRIIAAIQDDDYLRESAPITIIALSPTCAVSSWESEELDERPHALFLTAARKSLGSCQLGDAMEARPKQFRYHL